MAEYLVPVRVLLSSNVSEFRATFQRELRTLESSIVSTASTGAGGAPRTAAGARASAQGQLATLGGRTTAEIESLRPQLGNDVTDRALAAARHMLEQTREGIQRGLQAVYGSGFTVPAPTTRQLENATGRAAPAAASAAARQAAQAAIDSAQAEATAQAGRAVGGRTLSPAGVAAYRAHLAGPEGPDLAKRAGQTGALDVQLGRLTGVFQELELAEPEIQAMLVNLRATVASLTHYRNTIEDAATEQARISALQSQANTELADATGDLARSRRERQLIERGIKRDATGDLVGAEGEDAARTRARNLEVEGARIGATTPAEEAAAAKVAAARDAQADRINAQTRRQARLDDDILDSAASSRLAQRDLNYAVNERARQNDPRRGEGTYFQRLQANIAQRQGSAPRGAQEYQQLGQFLQSRALTTAGFAASGAVLYGGVNFLGNVLKESEELQQQLSIVKAQMANIEQSGQKISFEKFRSEIQDIAVATGTTADQVAFVTRQLAGAFADQQGRPNYGKALSEGRTALEYSKISGFPQQEITDSLTGISLAFEDNGQPLLFERILDQATYLEDRLGVLSQETIKFVADLAPLGKELGFTYEQLAGIGAVAQQASGRSGAVLSEQFGRILPFIQQNKAQVLGLFGQKDATAGAIPAIAKGFSDGNIPAVLANIIKYYDKLDATQKNVLGDMLGGQRNANALFAVLNRAPQALKALEAGPKGQGSFDKRMDEYRKTVAYAFDQLGREAEKLGNTLYKAGIADAFTLMAQGAQLAFKALNLLITAFVELNRLAGGFPGKAAVVLGILVSLRKAATVLAGTEVGAGFLSRFGLPGAMAAGGLPVGATMSQVPQAGAGRFALAAAGALPGQFGSPYAASGRTRIGVSIAQRTPFLRNMLTQVTPQAAAASGGALTAGATTAGLGTAAAGGLATAGLTIGALMAAQAVQSFFERRAATQKEVSDARDGAVEALKAGVAKGLTPAKLLEEFEKSVAETSLRRGSSGKPVYGGDSKRDKAFTDALDKANAEDQKDLFAQQLSLIKDLAESKGESNNALIDSILSAANRSNVDDPKDADFLKLLEAAGIGNNDTLFQGKRQFTPNGDVRSGRGTINNRNAGTQTKDPSYGSLADNIEQLQAYLLDNPDSEFAVNGMQQLIDAVALENKDTAEALQKAFDEFLAQKKKRGASGIVSARLQKLADSDADYQALVANLQYEIANGGGGTTQDLLGEIRKRNRGNETALRLAEKDGNLTPAQLAQLKKQVLDGRQLAAQAIQAQIDYVGQLSSSVADIAGVESSAEQKLNAAQTNYTAVLNAPELSYRQRADAAVKLILAQREAFAAAVDAASPAEALKLLAEGAKTDPLARRSFISDSLRDNPAIQAYLEANRSVINPDVNDQTNRAKLIEEAVQIVDENGSEAAIAWVEAMIEQTAKTLPGNGVGPATQNPAYLRLEALLAALRADPTGLLNLGDPGVVAKRKVQEQQAINSTANELSKSLNPNDPIGNARSDVSRAEADLAAIKQFDPSDYEGIEKAQIAINNAKNSLVSAQATEAKALADAVAAVARARANGDPVKEAAADIAAAAAASATAKTEAEKQQALAQTISANNAAANAANDIAAAQGEYQSELLAGDPIAQARQNLDNADRQVATAKGAAEKWRAMIARLQAQRELRNAILDAFVAQKDVAIAVAEGAGETVKAALLQLQVAQQKFNEAKANGTKGAALDQLRADLIRQQTNVTNTVRNDRLGDLEYLYEFDKLTANSYIALLQAELQKIPESNKEARRAIERRIKALRDEMSSDLTTNLPSEIKLPILYEARRLNQISAATAGAGFYQSTRIGSVSIVVPGAGAPADVAQAVADALLSVGRSSSTGSQGILVGL